MSKETQRAELHKAIWRIANDLRGSVDGWDFKSYVLGMLFYRFISENLAAYLNEQERQAGTSDFDFAKLGDAEAEHGRATTVEEKGFFILPSELFANVRARANTDARYQENLNEALQAVFRNIEGSAVGAERRMKPTFHRSNWANRPRVPISVWSTRMSRWASTILLSTASSLARSEATLSDTR